MNFLLHSQLVHDPLNILCVELTRELRVGSLIIHTQTACQKRLVSVELYHFCGWNYILLFHCRVLLALLNDHLLSIHDVQALCGILYLTTVEVIVSRILLRVVTYGLDGCHIVEGIEVT